MAEAHAPADRSPQKAVALPDGGPCYALVLLGHKILRRLPLIAPTLSTHGGQYDKFAKCRPTKSPKPSSERRLRCNGPGLLESAYVQCLCYELNLRNLPFLLELPVPVSYKGLKL